MKYVIDQGLKEPRGVFVHSIALAAEAEKIVLTSQANAGCRLSLVLQDPRGTVRMQYFFGALSNERTLHRIAAKSGELTVPGELPAGEWRLHVYARMPGADALGPDRPEPGYRIAVAAAPASRGGEPAAPGDSADEEPLADWDCWVGPQTGEGFALNAYPWDRVIDPAARWYKGDFHTHSVFSDGASTPDLNVRRAVECGLDFFAATDHNILPTSWARSDVLVLPGVEVTTPYGDGNMLGVREWADYWTFSEEQAIALYARMKSSGALCSVNHPFAEPLHWKLASLPLALLDTLEVWNGRQHARNRLVTESALRLWSRLLNEGYCVAGIGGSDTHDSGTRIGSPATYVWCDGLSAERLVRGVRAGGIVVSGGPFVDFSVSVGSELFKAGDNASAALSERGGEAVARVKLLCADAVPGGSDADAVPGGGKTGTPPRIQWVGDGTVIREERGTESELRLDWSGRGYQWLRVDVRDGDGHLLAFTNPVFCGSRTPSVATWGELMEAFR